jgi:hypothetical protein
MSLNKISWILVDIWYGLLVAIYILRISADFFHCSFVKIVQTIGFRPVGDVQAAMRQLRRSNGGQLVS